MTDALAEDDTGPTAAGIPAPYGKACVNCAKAKCRCLYRNEGGTVCERCHRLKKECVPSVSVRKRHGKRQLTSRAAQLEEKLDDLFTLLKNQTGKLPILEDAAEAARQLGIATPSPSNHSAGQSQLVESPKTSDCVSPETSQGAASASSAIPHSVPACSDPPLHYSPRTATAILTSVFNPHPSEKPPTLPSCPPSYLPTPEQAEENLDIFRDQMLRFFPFVYIHPAMTARELRQQRPFLWFTIQTLTCTAVSQQLSMGDAIKSHLAQKIIVENERSMDLLLGLLAFMAWSHYARKEKPFLSAMAGLLMSLVYDLVLHRTPGEPSGTLCFRPVYEPPKPTQPKARSTEERRALLSSFYLTSVLSIDLKRIEPLVWTPHMDESLQVLTQQDEWIGDKVLVTLVRAQLLTDQMNRATWQSKDGALPALYLSALRSQLHTIKSQIPPEIENYEIVVGLTLYTELIINEVALYKDPGLANNPDFQRHQLLESCLDLISAWFDRFFKIPPSRYVGITFSFFCQMAHSLMMLFHLSMRDDPAWDRAAVRAKLNVFEMCDRLCVGFEEVSKCRRHGLNPDEDIFVKCSRITRLMKDWWHAELSAADQSANLAAASGAPAGPASYVDGVTTGPLAMPMSQFMLDDAWLTDIFNVSWE